MQNRTLENKQNPFYIQLIVFRNSYFDGSKEATNLNTMELMCLFILVERNLGQQSFWSPYISMLPSNFSTPSYFTNDKLKHTPLFFSQHGQAELANIRHCYSSLQHFISGNFCGRKTRGMVLNFDDVRWAWNAVNTRCVYMKEQSRFENCQKRTTSCSLAPLLDLLNHSCNVEVIIFNNFFSQILALTNIHTYYFP